MNENKMKNIDRKAATLDRIIFIIIHGKNRKILVKSLFCSLLKSFSIKARFGLPKYLRSSVVSCPIYILPLGYVIL
jgi:hypothetical protein